MAYSINYAKWLQSFYFINILAKINLLSFCEGIGCTVYFKRRNGLAGARIISDIMLARGEKINCFQGSNIMKSYIYTSVKVLFTYNANF